MKILLIKPPAGSKSITSTHVSLCEPLGLEVIAANIKDHDVEILDLRLDSYEKFEDRLNQFQPDIIGISIDTVEVNQARMLLRKTKEINPQIVTVVGGSHPTYYPQDFYSAFVDVVVIGEGVNTFSEIVKAIELKEDLINIPNLALKKGSQQIFTSKQSYEKTIYPAPNRKLVDQYRKNYYYAWVKPVYLVQSSRGARSDQTIGPRSVDKVEYQQLKPVEQVAAEIADLHGGIVFVDDDPLSDIKYFGPLCQLLKQSSINKPIYLCSTPESVISHPELIQDLKDIGLLSIALKFNLPRSFNEFTSSHERKAANIIKSNDVFLTGEISIDPDFSRDDFKRLKVFVEKLKIDFPVYLINIPLPGTQLFIDKKLELSSPDWELFDRIHSVLPTRIPLKEFYHELADIYQESYSNLKFIQLIMNIKLMDLIVMKRNLNQFISQIVTAHKDQ